MDRPQVVVAMATFNGLPWISKQVQSILGQRGVDVRMVISDDGSTDGTVQWLRELAALDDRVHIAPARGGEAGVGPNFLYLTENVQPMAGEYVAFSDQDDLWHPNKLVHQIGFLDGHGGDATSSNVLSFDSRGNARVIVKSQPLRRWDFIFEAPGPGSTFLLTDKAFWLVREGLRDIDPQHVWLHDWLIYALVRAAGARWVIDPRPHVAYRQHDKNELGEHRGRRAISFRWANLRSGRYREQFELVAKAAVAQGRRHRRDERWLNDLENLRSQVTRPPGRPRPGLLRFVPEMRRKRWQGLALGGMGVLGLW